MVPVVVAVEDDGDKGAVGANMQQEGPEDESTGGRIAAAAAATWRHLADRRLPTGKHVDYLE